MAKLLIQTQVYENYGAHDWNGEGECPQYWKAKGGSDYVLPNFTAFTDTASVVEALKPQVEANNHGWREWVIHWEVLADDQPTPWEADQLRWDGRVAFPAKVLTLPVEA